MVVGAGDVQGLPPLAQPAPRQSYAPMAGKPTPSSHEPPRQAEGTSNQKTTLGEKGEMRYGGDDRLYVLSCRIRTRNKHSAEFNFPNVEAKHEEQRNCLKCLVGRIDVFAILPTGFGKSLIFQLFPQIKHALK